jgi:hypothetical protein
MKRGQNRLPKQKNFLEFLQFISTLHNEFNNPFSRQEGKRKLIARQKIISEVENVEEIKAAVLDSVHS